MDMADLAMVTATAEYQAKEYFLVAMWPAGNQVISLNDPLLTALGYAYGANGGPLGSLGLADSMTTALIGSPTFNFDLMADRRGLSVTHP